jgi:class 3 adenylate cyclase
VVSAVDALAVLLAGIAAAFASAAVMFRRRCLMLTRRVEQSAGELERLQRSFARFAPRAVVDTIASDGALPPGERREVTVMFADIRGFTRMSEELDPAVIIEMLNGYFGRMSAVIRAHHGHVTRIMGDGMMSVFGALERNPWHVQDAVEAAVEMRRVLAAYNEDLRAAARPELGFGIGIHCGTVVAGLVGGEGLLEFTVMGDVVNVASRVEALTRDFDTDILVTASVKGVLGERFATAAMPAVPIKGKRLPLETWAVHGRATVRAAGAAAQR